MKKKKVQQKSKNTVSPRLTALKKKQFHIAYHQFISVGVNASIPSHSIFIKVVHLLF